MSGGGDPACGEANKVLNGNIVVSEFELKSRYYVHFRTNTLGKGMNTLILQTMGLIVLPLFFFKDGFGFK